MTDVAAIQDMKSSLSSVQEQLDRLEKEVQEKASQLFSAEAKHLFEKYPAVTSVSWAQFTPYFNDGDECVFSSHSPSRDSSWGDLDFNGYSSDYGEWFDGEEHEGETPFADTTTEKIVEYLDNPDFDRSKYQTYSGGDNPRYIQKVSPNPKFDPQAKEAKEAFYAFFRQFDEQTFKRLFGDHVSCTLTKDGVKTEYYEHE